MQARSADAAMCFDQHVNRLPMTNNTCNINGRYTVEVMFWCSSLTYSLDVSLLSDANGNFFVKVAAYHLRRLR